MAELTQARLKELLTYDPDTGVFTYNTGTGRCRAGTVAGTATARGYRQICIDYRVHLAHRLAFVYMLGAAPAVVDHVNGEKCDNRWANLRAATISSNAQNQRHSRKGNASGFLGVHWSRRLNKWQARIKPADGPSKYLGSFTDPEEAHQAYLTAKRQLHTGCTI